VERETERKNDERKRGREILNMKEENGRQRRIENGKKDITNKEKGGTERKRDEKKQVQRNGRDRKSGGARILTTLTTETQFSGLNNAQISIEKQSKMFEFTAR
jgi:hypothetical protein